jgi:serine/threonine protein kinase
MAQQELCGYQFVRRLGQGSYGTVDEVVKEGKHYAMKTEHFPHLLAIGISSSALREAAVLAQFHVPNILHSEEIFFGCGQTFNLRKPELHSVLPLARGGNLQEWLTTNPSTEERASAMNDILSGLEMLHAVGLVHGDLKSQNILMVDGQAQLSDFGNTIQDLGQTKYAPVGTPAYMAPEIILQDTQYTALSDMWSFGVIVWELFTDNLFTLPEGHEYGSPHPILHRIIEVHGKPTDWPRDRIQKIALAASFRAEAIPAFHWLGFPATVRQRLGPTLTGNLERVLNACLEPDPQRRITSALAVRLPIFKRFAPPEGDFWGSEGSTPIPDYAQGSVKFIYNQLRLVFKHHVTTTNFALELLERYYYLQPSISLMDYIVPCYYLAASLREQQVSLPQLLTAAGATINEFLQHVVDVAIGLAFRFYTRPPPRLGHDQTPELPLGLPGQ